MRGPRRQINGATTHAIVDGHGPGRHAFGNGHPALLNVYIDANGDATEVEEQWCNDVTVLMQNACADGNGVDGPNSDDAEADYFELSNAINSMPSATCADDSFVANGLLISTNGGSLNVTVEPGVLIEDGLRRVLSLERLDAGEATIDGAAAGTAQAFTLLPNLDHYVAVETDEVTLTNAEGQPYLSPTRVVRINIVTTALGAGEPAAQDMPAGKFFSVLSTDGTGVTSQQWVDLGPRMAAYDHWRGVRLRPQFPTVGSALEPVNVPTYAVDLGSASSYERPNLGHYFRGLFIQETTMRTGGTTTFAGHRVHTETHSQSVLSGSTPDIILFDGDDLPDDFSMVTIIIDCQVRSQSDQLYAYNEYTNILYKQGGTLTLDPSAAGVPYAKFNDGTYPDPNPRNMTNNPGNWEAHSFIHFNLSGTNVRAELRNNPAGSVAAHYHLTITLKYLVPPS